MSIKCVITDIDQTLTDMDMKLTARTKAAVEKARRQGINIILCSGRPYNGMKDYIESLQLMDTISIGFNGGVIYNNATSEILRTESFQPEDLERLIDCLLSTDCNFHLEAPDRIYTGFTDVGKYTVRDSFVTDMPLSTDSFISLKRRRDICKIMVADYPEKLDSLVIPGEMIPQYKFVRSRPYYLEIVPGRVNKGCAVRIVADIMKCTREEILGIGDGMNDYELLREAGIAVAVDNADERIKKIAHYIVPAHDEDGFAIMLEGIMK